MRTDHEDGNVLFGIAVAVIAEALLVAVLCGIAWGFLVAFS